MKEFILLLLVLGAAIASVGFQNYELALCLLWMFVIIRNGSNLLKNLLS